MLQRSADKEHLHEQNLPTSIWAVLIIAFLYLLRFCIDMIIGAVVGGPTKKDARSFDQVIYGYSS